MKKIICSSILSIIILACLSGQRSQSFGSIHISFDNLENDKGIIAINLFDKEDGFPSNYEKAIQKHTIELNKKQVVFVLENIPPGEYAISILHDENSNFKLDTNFFGVPKEGYAVSNNAKPRKFGPPKYEDAIFNHGESDSHLQLTIRY